MSFGLPSGANQEREQAVCMQVLYGGMLPPKKATSVFHTCEGRVGEIRVSVIHYQRTWEKG